MARDKLFQLNSTEYLDGNRKSDNHSRRPIKKDH